MTKVGSLCRSVEGWGALVALVLLVPSSLRGQSLAREALATFPADTHQITYVNLTQLRSLPDYQRVRVRLLGRQINDFQEFLRAAGTDLERDVEEVVLGWRGEATGRWGYFGVAQGSYQPDRIRQFFAQYELPVREYAGYELYVFGSGEDRADTFFCFLSTSLAAFGRRQDLRAMLDIRHRAQLALDSVATFVEWEAELEGTAPQWGIVTGRAAANHAIGWLSAGGKLAVDPSIVLGIIQAVLYRADWSGGLTTSAAIVCKDAETASALAQLLTAWRDSRPAVPAEVATFLQGLQITANGSRVELQALAPLEAVEHLLRGPASSQAP